MFTASLFVHNLWNTIGFPLLRWRLVVYHNAHNTREVSLWHQLLSLFVIMKCIVMQKVFTVGVYIRKKHCEKYHSKFGTKFPDISFPSKLTVYGLVNKIQIAGFLLRRKSKHNLFFQKKH